MPFVCRRREAASGSERPRQPDGRVLLGLVVSCSSL